MTFVFEKEKMRAIHENGHPMGSILFPRIRSGLVNIHQVTVLPEFREQGVADAMMEALLTYLTDQNLNAALTCPYAQQYVKNHPQWVHILPGSLHFTTH